MNIHKSRGDRVIVELSSNELSRYELCPEEMDCKNPKTRRLINDVMKRAQRHIRRDITSFDKMNVDVMETDEGCIMILCFKGIKTKRPFSGYVCVLPQTDDILARSVNIGVGLVGSLVYGVSIRSTEGEILAAAERIADAVRKSI